jgi:hypothetical protein
MPQLMQCSMSLSRLMSHQPFVKPRPSTVGLIHFFCGLHAMKNQRSRCYSVPSVKGRVGR